jgi:parvulin-like peptidyl-prolyl isomerase
MRRLFILLFLLTVVFSGCGNKNETIKLKKDSPAYQLAKELSAKLQYLDPDKNNPVATTKEFTLTTGEVIGSIYDNSGNRTNQLKTMDPNRLKGIILQTAQRMAEHKLVLNEAKNAKFMVPQPVLDSLLNLQYSRAGGEDKFVEMIQKSGANIEAVKKDIRNFITFDRYLEETLAEQIDVSEEEVASVRHILLMTQGKNEAEKGEIRKKMEGILAQAKQGKDFAELAKQYTEDPGSKENGGLYENFPKGQMVKPFEDAAFSVPVGEISDIVETRYGFHILKIVTRDKFKSLDQPDPDLEKQLKSKIKGQAYQDYLTKLKEAYEYKEVTF